MGDRRAGRFAASKAGDLRRSHELIAIVREFPPRTQPYFLLVPSKYLSYSIIVKMRPILSPLREHRAHRGPSLAEFDRVFLVNGAGERKARFLHGMNTSCLPFVLP